ncbi:MAG: hypothetical protein ACK5GN_05385 [Pseudomonadota bacterium]
MPVKLARLLLDITIGCCFDSHPRIDSGRFMGLDYTVINRPQSGITVTRLRTPCLLYDTPLSTPLRPALAHWMLLYAPSQR